VKLRWRAISFPTSLSLGRAICHPLGVHCIHLHLSRRVRWTNILLDDGRSGAGSIPNPGDLLLAWARAIRAAVVVFFDMYELIFYPDNVSLMCMLHVYFSLLKVGTNIFMGTISAESPISTIGLSPFSLPAYRINRKA
jgi:hypothetical protein